MSQAAIRQRADKQRWAMPGSRHDKLVRVAKVALPSAVGVLIAVLAVAPLEKDGDVSFILDKNKVDNAPERMRVDVAQYRGEDNQGRPFAIVARSAVQQSSEVADRRHQGDDGEAGARPAGRWRSSPTTPATTSTGSWRRSSARSASPAPTATGWRPATSSSTSSAGASPGSGNVRGEMRLGQFTAGRLTADLGERTVTLDQGARLKIVQGAVR